MESEKRKWDRCRTRKAVMAEPVSASFAVEAHVFKGAGVPDRGGVSFLYLNVR